MSRLFRCGFVLLLLAFASPLCASFIGQQEPAGYSSRLDGPGHEFIYDSAVDNSGNVYVVGRSRSSEMNLDVIRDSSTDNTGRPALDTHATLVANPNGGGFVVKYDRNGVIIWKKFVGTKITDWISGVAVDAAEGEASMAVTMRPLMNSRLIVILHAEGPARAVSCNRSTSERNPPSSA